MNWFKKNTNPVRVAEPDPMQIKLDNTKMLSDALVAQTMSRVSKLDYVDAVLESLILLHPEVAAQQPFVEFATRLEKFMSQKMP